MAPLLLFKEALKLVVTSRNSRVFFGKCILDGLQHPEIGQWKWGHSSNAAEKIGTKWMLKKLGYFGPRRGRTDRESRS